MSKAFSLFDMDSLIRGAGAQRVDERASRKLREKLEDDAKKILSKARVYATHAKRKQITGRDIRLAAKNV
ncbi:MAG: histone [Candidatus Micrarchaeota archaeon]